jgi:fructose-1,6-bisphosphatase
MVVSLIHHDERELSIGGGREVSSEAFDDEVNRPHSRSGVRRLIRVAGNRPGHRAHEYEVRGVAWLVAESDSVLTRGGVVLDGRNG